MHLLGKDARLSELAGTHSIGLIRVSPLALVLQHEEKRRPSSDRYQ